MLIGRFQGLVTKMAGVVGLCRNVVEGKVGILSGSRGEVRSLIELFGQSILPAVSIGRFVQSRDTRLSQVHRQDVEGAGPGGPGSRVLKSLTTLRRRLTNETDSHRSKSLGLVLEFGWFARVILV